MNLATVGFACRRQANRKLDYMPPFTECHMRQKIQPNRNGFYLFVGERMVTCSIAKFLFPCVFLSITRHTINDLINDWPCSIYTVNCNLETIKIGKRFPNPGDSTLIRQYVLIARKLRLPRSTQSMRMSQI